MAREPEEQKIEEGTPRIVRAKEISANKIKQAGKKVLSVVKWE